MSQDTLAGPVPTAGDSPNVPADMLAFANTVGQQIVPAFSSTAQRDTAYAATQFTACWVGDVLWKRSGSQWLQVFPQRTGFGELELSAADTFTVAASGWTKLSVGTTEYTVGGGLNNNSNAGIQVTNTGRYYVKAYAAMGDTNTGTRRIIAAYVGSPSGSGTMYKVGNWYPRIGVGTTLYMAAEGHMSLTAGQIVSLWVYTNSTDNHFASSRFLLVRRLD